MYWNNDNPATGKASWLININMRCIEIGGGYGTGTMPTGLTLTWDVLKLHHQQCLKMVLPD